MPRNILRDTILTVLFVAVGPLGALAAAPVPRPAAAFGKTGVAAHARSIVSGIHGSWQLMPGNIVTRLMTPGALIGNGSVGVALGGSPDQQEFYFGRDDFWSVLRGRIMPAGRLQLSVPLLHSASARLQENIGPADVTGEFDHGSARLRSTSWVANGSNLLVVQLHNTGAAPIPVDASLWDAFGHQDRTTLAGTSGPVQWLRVSPEVVPGTIGGPIDGSGSAAGLRIRAVHVYAGYFPGPAAQAGQKPLYAWSSKSGLADKTAFRCGDIILPQDRFTVRALVDAGTSDETAALLSAVVHHRWMKQTQDPVDPLGNIRGHDIPRAQGPSAGLLIYLAHGRLAANLNGTAVTASQPLPLRRWTKVSVAYDGRQLVLLVNGAIVGRTRNFPAAAQVMGPLWQWAASHPGDTAVPYRGSAPQAVLAMRILGARASLLNGQMRFVISPGSAATILVAVADNRDRPDYFSRSLSRMKLANAAMVNTLWMHHQAWWRNFWSKSYIEIPDKTLQSWWYGSLYVLASCSEPGQVAPGLWGNWITSPHMGWQGDYTLDYNYEAPFWAAFPTNHVDLADPYDAPLLAWMQRGRALAAKLGRHGILYYAHLAPSPVWSADNFRSLDQKSDALFSAMNCIQRWRYTSDPAYAQKVWPFLLGIADYWDHDLKLVRGRYVDFNDAPDEHLWGPANDTDPATTIGFLNMLYPALIDMSRQLHRDQQMRPVWQRMLSHLSPLPLAPADSVAAIRNAVPGPIPPGQLVILQSRHGMQWVNISRGDRFAPIPPVRVTGSSAGMDSLQSVFPAWNIGVESSPRLRRAAVNTVDYMRLWYDANDTSSFYPAAADAGYHPDSILRHLHRLVTHIGYPNFAYNIPAGGVENEATVPTTIAAMLLQSYQKNIHVFPDWPRNQNASFGNLLAVGDFLVSSRMVDGTVAYVRIHSRRGGICRLANPWNPERPIQLQIPGRKPLLLHGPVLQVPTHSGEQLVFTTLPHPPPS